MNSKVLLIYTGGTIGMIKKATNEALYPFDFQSLLKNIPELRDYINKHNTNRILTNLPRTRSEFGFSIFSLLLEFGLDPEFRKLD